MKINVSFNTLVGKTLTSVEQGDAFLCFRTSTGEVYDMYHEQDCCENVDIEDICGELEWLIGSPILLANEDTNRGEVKDNYVNSCTWTFYNIATAKGHVTIRWYGSSNGYYSESVSFKQIS